MNIDPTGALASIVAAVMPDTTVQKALEVEEVTEGFASFLQQVSVVPGQYSPAQLPRKPEEWDQWIREMELPLSEDGDFLENLHALKAQLKTFSFQVGPPLQALQGEEPAPAKSQQESTILSEIFQDGETGSGSDSLTGQRLPRMSLEVPENHEASPEEGLSEAFPSPPAMKETESIVDKVHESDPGPPDSPLSDATLEIESGVHSKEGFSGGNFTLPMQENWESMRPLWKESANHDELLSSDPSEEGTEDVVDRLEENPQPRVLTGRSERSITDDSSSRYQQRDVPEIVDSARNSASSVPLTVSGEDKAPQSTTLNLPRPFDHPEWANDLGERMLWMHGRSLQVAELRLNPQHLGPIEVRIHMQDDQTSIQFSSHHAVVRDAIESALPRLREMFGVQQLQLVQVEVTGDALPDQRQFHAGHHGSDNDYESPNPQDGEPDLDHGAGNQTGQLPVSGNRLLNLYA